MFQIFFVVLITILALWLFLSLFKYVIIAAFIAIPVACLVWAGIWIYEKTTGTKVE